MNCRTRTKAMVYMTAISCMGCMGTSCGRKKSRDAPEPRLVNATHAKPSDHDSSIGVRPSPPRRVHHKCELCIPARVHAYDKTNVKVLSANGHKIVGTWSKFTSVEIDRCKKAPFLCKVQKRDGAVGWVRGVDLITAQPLILAQNNIPLFVAVGKKMLGANGVTNFRIIGSPWDSDGECRERLRRRKKTKKSTDVVVGIWHVGSWLKKTINESWFACIAVWLNTDVLILQGLTPGSAVQIQQVLKNMNAISKSRKYVIYFNARPNGRKRCNHKSELSAHIYDANTVKRTYRRASHIAKPTKQCEPIGEGLEYIRVKFPKRRFSLYSILMLPAASCAGRKARVDSLSRLSKNLPNTTQSSKVVVLGGEWNMDPNVSPRRLRRLAKRCPRSGNLRAVKQKLGLYDWAKPDSKCTTYAKSRKWKTRSGFFVRGAMVTPGTKLNFHVHGLCREMSCKGHPASDPSFALASLGRNCPVTFSFKP